MTGEMLYKQIFKEINSIPRPSHHEELIADYLCSFAESRGLSYRRDDRNCVVIEKPATPGYEDEEPVVLLNHMDMVCVADPDYRYNPLTDAIEAYEEVGADGHRWMKAHGTSLGADNGIGLSMALAVLADDTLEHPALEVLTTTCEEDDMSGAAGLSADFIRGRRVINLDSEAYDEITMGAAGAKIQVARLPYGKIAMPSGYVAYTVGVSGGKGGHSGVDINKGRGNAIKILANLLLVAIRQINIKIYLVNINGGQAYSAIPDDAVAKIVLPKENVEEFEMLVSQCNDAVAAQFADTDPDLMVECEESVWHSSVVSEEGTHLLLACINGIPVGPTAMREDMEGTVMTSNNIGIVKQSGNTFTISTHTRSFDDAALEDLAGNIARIFMLTGATMETVMSVPAWQEDASSDWVDKTCSVFQDVLGFAPRKVAMHFALEAGYLVNTFPGLHISSIGPRIDSPHSTSEKVDMDTADNIWKVLVELLRRR